MKKNLSKTEWGKFVETLSLQDSIKAIGIFLEEDLEKYAQLSDNLSRLSQRSGDKTFEDIRAKFLDSIKLLMSDRLFTRPIYPSDCHKDIKYKTSWAVLYLKRIGVFPKCVKEKSLERSMRNYREENNLTDLYKFFQWAYRLWKNDFTYKRNRGLVENSQ